MNINFNHDESDLSSALGLSEEDKTYCHINIIFSIVNSKLMGSRLYDDESELPRTLTSVSGDLEGIISRTRKDAEIVFSCMQYHSVKNVYYNFVDAYVDSNGDFNGLYTKIKDRLPNNDNEDIDVKIIKMTESDDDDDDDEEKKQEFIAAMMKKLFGKENDSGKKKRAKEVFDIIKICDESKGSFSNFYEKTKDKNI